jgi:hypothetical protein
LPLPPFLITIIQKNKQLLKIEIQLFSTATWYLKNNLNLLKKIKSENDETQEWSLTDEEVKSVAEFENLTEDKIAAVLNFLVELAKLEIKLQEE